MSEIFETDDEKMKMKIEEQPKGKGKHKKVMSPERKAALTEQLKKARIISREKRGAKAKAKKLQKLKELESEIVDEPKKVVLEPNKVAVEPKVVLEPKVEAVLMKPLTNDNGNDKGNDKEPEENLETKIEKRLRLKLEAEYSNSYDHKLKDYKILTLQERLNEYKETKKMKIIKEEEEIKEIIPPKPKVIDNISPLSSRNLMDKYRRIQAARKY